MFVNFSVINLGEKLKEKLFHQRINAPAELHSCFGRVKFAFKIIHRGAGGKNMGPEKIRSFVLFSSLSRKIIIVCSESSLSITLIYYDDK